VKRDDFVYTVNFDNITPWGKWLFTKHRIPARFKFDDLTENQIKILYYYDLVSEAEERGIVRIIFDGKSEPLVDSNLDE